MKNYGVYNNEKRLQALQAYAITDTDSEKVFDEIVAEAAAITGCTLAALTFVDDSRTWVKASTQTLPRFVGNDESFCTYGVLEPELMEVYDASKDERFLHLPAVQAGQIKYYAGAQVQSTEGLALGMLCVTHEKQYRLTALQRRQLTDLAARVSALLELRLV